MKGTITRIELLIGLLLFFFVVVPVLKSGDWVNRYLNDIHYSQFDPGLLAFCTFGLILVCIIALVKILVDKK